jgi:hypothetical protein
MRKKDRRPAKKLVKKRGQGGGGTSAKNPKKKNTTMGKPNTGSSGMDMVSKAARPRQPYCYGMFNSAWEILLKYFKWLRKLLLMKAAMIKVANGYVTFSRKFKYLGSRISYSLCDDDDINARLAAASQSMGALKEVWRNSHLDTYSKYLLFCAIPVNLLLWGCENWSLRQSPLRQLEVFLHQNIRRILNLSMSDVKERQI